jgi:hypothetical protein
MRMRLVRRPGQHSAKDLVAQYSEQLICVRYRYNPIREKRYKTVELILETVDWSLAPASDTVVALRVAIHERDVQQTIRARRRLEPRQTGVSATIRWSAWI